MSALAILARAEAAGLTVTADAGTLRLAAAAPPPTALLHDLAGVKAELLALLAERDAEAAERAAIMAEPRLPPIGSPERIALDAQQARTVAGLLQASTWPRARGGFDGGGR